MITLPEVYDLFASLPSGGYITAESRLEKGLMYAIINKSKNKAIQMTYSQIKRTSPAWYVPFYPEYDTSWQTDPCIKRFRMPDYPLLDGVGSGLGYIGAVGRVNTFIPIEGRVQFETFMNHPKLRPRNKDIYILIENGWADVYGTVRDFKIMIMPSDPRDIPTYNEKIDPYPVDGTLLEMMVKIAQNPDLVMITKTPFDKIQNGMDDSVIKK